MAIETTMRGPIFDGTATAAVDDYIAEATREISDLAVNEIQARLGQVLENPSGRYRNKIQTDRTTTDLVVTDGGMVYGPWLEGTSSRNKTTRFKGYATFRRTRQWLEGRAQSVAEGKLGRHLDRMGGG